MSFPLKDVPLTTRRSTAGLAIYPRLLRDRSINPKVDIAIQYFESMVGHERRELEPEVLVHFFGDHKLARCMVACLGRSYRYQPRRFAEVVTPRALRKLTRAGIEAPRHLRLHLFDRVNDFGNGFADGADRIETIGGEERRLGLRPGEMDQLLFLDAEEHAILTRVGAEPRAGDLVAQYNFRVLESLLRYARGVHLTVAAPESGTAATVRAVAEAHAVDVTVEKDGSRLGVRLFGRQDALGLWSRHGRRLARAVAELVERARPQIAGGDSDVVLRDRQGTLTLADELLDFYGGAAKPCTGWTGDSDIRAAVEDAAADLRKTGWSIRSRPEPRVWAAGVVLPAWLARASGRRFFVVPVRSQAHGARLAPLAEAATSGEPLLFVGEAPALTPLANAWIAPTDSWTAGDVAPSLRRALEEQPLGQVA